MFEALPEEQKNRLRLENDTEHAADLERYNDACTGNPSSDPEEQAK